MLFLSFLSAKNSLVPFCETYRPHLYAINVVCACINVCMHAWYI